MYTYYLKEIRQFLTQSSSIELLHLVTKCATGRRSFVCRGTDGMFPAYRYCVKSKNKKNSDIKLTVLHLLKKCPNSMSEVNVRKWHTLIIASHFSSKIGHVKIRLETTLVLGYFYTACSGRCRPFCIFIRIMQMATLYGCIMGLTGSH